MARPFTPEMGRARAPRVHGGFWALLFFTVLVAGVWAALHGVVEIAARIVFAGGVFGVGFQVVAAVLYAVGYAVLVVLLGEDER